MLSGTEKEEELVLDLKNKNKSMDVNQKEVRVICSSDNLDEMEMMSSKPSPKITSRRIESLKRSASGKFIIYLIVKCSFRCL